MERRLFLRALAAGLVGVAIDVDKLLWVPGERTIFLPSSTGIEIVGSLNTLITPEWVMRECFRRLKNDLTFATHRNFDTELLVGDCVTARLPLRCQIVAGATA